MGEAEFIARVEEVAGPVYVRAAGPEAGGGPSLSSAGREVQQPYHKSIVHQFSWERRPMKRSGQSSTVKSGADVQTLQKKELTMAHSARCTNGCDAQIPMSALRNLETTASGTNE